MREVYRLVNIDLYAVDPEYFLRSLLWHMNEVRYEWARTGGGEADTRINLYYGMNGDRYPGDRHLVIRMATPRKAPLVGGAYGDR